VLIKQQDNGDSNSIRTEGIGQSSFILTINQNFPIPMKASGHLAAFDVSNMYQFFESARASENRCEPRRAVDRGCRAGFTPWRAQCARIRAENFRLRSYDKCGICFRWEIAEMGVFFLGRDYQCALTLIADQILWFNRENLEHKKVCLLIIQPSGSIPPSVRSNRSRQPGEVRERS
jgi:hypothetical protein